MKIYLKDHWLKVEHPAKCSCADSANPYCYDGMERVAEVRRPRTLITTALRNIPALGHNVFPSSLPRGGENLGFSSGSVGERWIL